VGLSHDDYVCGCLGPLWWYEQRTPFTERLGSTMPKASPQKPETSAPPAKNRPAFEIRMGRIRITAWRNVTKEGQEWFSFTATRSYKDGDTWKSANSFGVDDLLVLAAVCQRARWQHEQMRQAAYQEQRDDAGGGQEQQESPSDIPF